MSNGLFFDEPTRKPIKASVKKEVYQRAKGKCERCGIKMTMSQGHFHHTRTPTISPTAKTVQFLCPNCHSWHGHKRKTVTRGKGSLFEEKEQIVKRRTVKVKKTPKKRKTVKKKTAKKTKRKVKKSTKKKKTSKKRSTTRKKATSRKRKTTKKTKRKKK